MSTVEYNFELGGFQSPAPSPLAPMAKAVKQPLHRIAEVRQEQGVSVRSAARRLGLSMQEVRAQEEPTNDLRLSELHNWQKVLEVPLADLLLDSCGPLSTPVSQRALMLRVMKTVRALEEATHEQPVQRLASMLITQLIEVMPELKEVSAWHSVGQAQDAGRNGPDY